MLEKSRRVSSFPMQRSYGRILACNFSFHYHCSFSSYFHCMGHRRCITNRTDFWCILYRFNILFTLFLRKLKYTRAPVNAYFDFIFQEIPLNHVPDVKYLSKGKMAVFKWIVLSVKPDSVGTAWKSSKTIFTTNATVAYFGRLSRPLQEGFRWWAHSPLP